MGNESTNGRKRFLNEKEVAALLGIGVKTVQRWRSSATGPKYRKLCGSMRYEVDDVEAWVQRSPFGGEAAPSLATIDPEQNH